MLAGSHNSYQDYQSGTISPVSRGASPSNASELAGYPGPAHGTHEMGGTVHNTGINTAVHEYYEMPGQVHHEMPQGGGGYTGYRQ